MKFINLDGLTTAERLVVLENICNDIIGHLNKETLYTTVDEYSSSTLNYDIEKLYPKTNVMPESGQLVYFSNGYIGIIGNIDTIGNTYGVSEITDIKGEKGEPGEKGEKGDPGEKGEKGDPGETPTLFRHCFYFYQGGVYYGTAMVLLKVPTPYNATMLAEELYSAGFTSVGSIYPASGSYKSEGKDIPIYGIFVGGSTLYLAYSGGNSSISSVIDRVWQV